MPWFAAVPAAAAAAGGTAAAGTGAAAASAAAASAAAAGAAGTAAAGASTWSLGSSIAGWLASNAGYIAATSAAVGAGSTYLQGVQASKIAEGNANLAMADALARKTAGDLEVQQHREAVARAQSKGRVAALSQGLALSGTPLDILAENEWQAKRDEEIIKFNALSGANSSLMRANIERRRSKQYMTGGVLGAGSKLLESHGKYSYYKRT
jgi:hypothetical protein